MVSGVVICAQTHAWELRAACFTSQTVLRRTIDALCSYSSVHASCRALLLLLASVLLDFGHMSSPVISSNYDDKFGSFS